MSRAVATFGYVGLIRPAPGTWGSLVALAAGVGLYVLGDFPLLLLATLAVVPLGFWAVARELARGSDPDPAEIVIDEVAGQWVTLLFPFAAFWMRGMDPLFSVTQAWPGWVTAFVLFRIFDIWKPSVIGRADRRGGTLGVMLDDLWAGVFAGIATLMAAGLAHGVLMR